jgi:hypothetical protein
MTTTTVSPETFRAETARRLIDSFDLMNELGIRTRDTLTARVESGRLPEPVYRSATITLWDRDEIAALKR